ncbi:MAG: DUF456 family protein [Candidatus Nanopelagicales bacterium]
MTNLLVGLAILVVFAGTIVPILPGALLVAAALVVWAVITGGTTAWAVAIGALALVAAGQLLKYLIPGRQLKASGVPSWVLLPAPPGGSSALHHPGRRPHRRFHRRCVPRRGCPPQDVHRRVADNHAGDEVRGWSVLDRVRHLAFWLLPCGSGRPCRVRRGHRLALNPALLDSPKVCAKAKVPR